MGDLSEDTITEITDTIVVFDRVGDNKIDVNDIVNALRALDFNPGSDEWKETIDGFKKKGVSRIDIKQFSAIYEEESKKKRATKMELVEGLKSLDTTLGESGLINAATLKRYLANMGDTITDEQADSLIIPLLDSKGSNIHITEIVKLVMSGNVTD